MGDCMGSAAPMQPLPAAQSKAEQPVRWHAATRELVGGVLAGAVNVTSGYPFDTVKVRLQASHGVYSGMSDCFLHIWRTEGVSQKHQQEYSNKRLFRGLHSRYLAHPCVELSS